VENRLKLSEAEAAFIMFVDGEFLVFERPGESGIYLNKEDVSNLVCFIVGRALVKRAIGE
jgi:hypothetical protein